MQSKKRKSANDLAAVIGVLFLLFQAVSAQYRFDSFTTDNGLPQNGVRGIAQTPDGYLWFTTFDGLVRFDGLRFNIFDKNNTEGIVSNRFSMLKILPDGSLIAGTEDSGLVLYRNGVFRSFTTKDGLPSNTIQDFLKNRFGEFYVASTAGNFYFRGGAEFPAVLDAENPNNGRNFYAPSGNFWLYGEDGLREISPAGRETFYPLKTEFYNDYFSGVEFFEDRAGHLWFGDLNGVYCLKDGRVTKYSEKDGVPPRIVLRPFVEDSDGSLWFASALPWIEGVGIARFADGKFTVYGKNAGLSSHFIANLFKDREGTIWVTTDKGLNRLRKQFVKSYSVADGLIYNEVYPLLQSRDGSIYVGTIKGLSRFKDGKFENLDLRNNNGDPISVSALYEDKDGRLWIGAVGDLHILENGVLKTVPELFKKTVWAIRNDRAGNIWVASEKGLYKFQNERLVETLTVADGLPSDDVKFILPDGKGALWFGTYGGIAKLENGAFTTFTEADGLASNHVRTIHEDADGTLWIGTYDGGLSRFRDGRFFNFTMASGLFSNGVFQILEDRRANFWISCNKGIFRVGKNELEDFSEGRIAKITSVSYGKQDGMPNAEANGGRQPAGIVANDGKFWFPTQGGVAIVDPNAVSINPNPPPVKIESVLVEQRNVDFANGVAVGASKENLEIRYTGISFIKPEQVKFRYRIEGLDEEWTEIGNIREVYFPSLPAGEYVFHVIAANSDGVWNEDGATLKISVYAPFWKKTWFVALASLAAIFVIFTIFKLRERELRRRQFLQQEFSRKLLDSQEKERKRIASEMHDSLGQYLLAIKNWALFGLNSIPEKDAAREYLTEVSETSSLALEEVREIAHNLRPYQLERLGLTKTLRYMLKNIASSSSIEFVYEIDEIDGFLSKDDEIVFYRVVQECVNNVVKHSAARRSQVFVKLKENGLEFVCRDDGRGFDVEAAKSAPESGLGLSGIAERVKILKGLYRIEAASGRGVWVLVEVERVKG